MKTPELSVIINSYNRVDLLKKALPSIDRELSTLGRGYVLVVFDAGSSDGSISFIEEYSGSSKSSLVLLKSDPGTSASFSFGVNQACKYASQLFTSIKYFLFFETDNYIYSEKPLEKALKLLEKNSSIAACGFTVKKHNGSKAGFGSKFPSLFSFILGQQFSYALKIGRTQIKWMESEDVDYFLSEVVYTSPLLIRRNVWESVRGFDAEKFPFSDCDIDLAYRIHKAGWKMAVIQTEEVIHDNLSKQSSWSSTRTLNFYKARYQFFRKQYGSWISLLKPLLFLMHSSEFLILSVLTLFTRRSADSIKVRWRLMKSVFFNYSEK